MVIYVQKPRKIDTKKVMQRRLQNLPRNTNNITVDKFRQYEVSEWEYNNHKILTVGTGNKHIIYFHGGAYMLEASIFHIRLIRYFVKNGFKVTFMDYPLAPESDYKETNNFVISVYKEITKLYFDDIYYVFGDSAGGGLGLSFIEQVRDMNLKPIIKSALFSPWVNLCMNNDNIYEYNDKDKILPLKEIIKAAKIYSNNEDLTNPLISPFYGDLTSLGDILLFAGENELLYPDIIELYNKLKNVNNVELIVGPKSQHDWILFPTLKSKEALERIISFFLE